MLAAEESKLQKFTADHQIEFSRKNYCMISIQMAREGRDVISVCCMKNDAENIVSYADGMKDIWRWYMEKLLHVVNHRDGEVDCTEVMEPSCLISAEEVTGTVKGLKLKKKLLPLV